MDVSVLFEYYLQIVVYGDTAPLCTELVGVVELTGVESDMISTSP